MLHVVCNLCGADDARERFPATLSPGDNPLQVDAFRCTYAGYGQHFRVVTCRRCGLTYADPRLTPEETLVAYRAVEDPLYVQEQDGRSLTFTRHIADLERLRAPPGRVLDVGAYSGVFVEVAKSRGWDSVGLEPSRWAVEQARRKGLSIIEGTLATSSLPTESFDVVTMWDVIEHMCDPLAELRISNTLLRPGGLVVIHTMDIDSLFARVMGKRWPWLMEMHIFFFSQRTLADLVRKAGFRVISSRARGRYLRLGYLATRIGGISRPMGRMAATACRILGVEKVAVPVNFGDLFTLYAEKV